MATKPSLSGHRPTKVGRITAIISDMTSDLDIYRTANLLIKQHGLDAAIEAAIRADELLNMGDLGGYALWKRIRRAVEELEGVEPGQGERVN